MKYSLPLSFAFLSILSTSALAESNEFFRIGLGGSDVFTETETEVAGFSFFEEDSVSAGFLYLAGGSDRESNRTYGQLGFSVFEDANLLFLGIGHDWMFTSRPFQPYVGLSGGLAWLTYTEDYDDGVVTVELEGERARGPAIGGQLGLYYQLGDTAALDVSLQALGTSIETEVTFPGLGSVNNEITFIGNTVASLSFVF